MPLHRSAKKRMRQNEKRRLRNRMVKTRLKSLRKKVTASESSEEAGQLLREAYKLYDRAADRGVVHKNKAAREKSRLAVTVSKKFS
jgi:small subunit ribosomal protein S20